MDKRSIKTLGWGFLFGTGGLFVLAALSLALQPVEYLGNVLFFPGRMIVKLFIGPNGTTGDVILLTLANGVIYALIFWGISALRNRNKPVNQ